MQNILNLPMSYNIEWLQSCRTGQIYGDGGGASNLCYFVRQMILGGL